MRVRSDVINELLPTVAVSLIHVPAFEIPHATVGNNALMTSEGTRIDDMYES